MSNSALKNTVLDLKGAKGWTPDLLELEGYPGESKTDRKKQVAFFGVYDGLAFVAPLSCFPFRADVVSLAVTAAAWFLNF